MLEREQSLRLHRGKQVRWQVTSAQGARFSSEFSIADKAEFHMDGKVGLPISESYRGLGGTGGGSLRCRLSRDQAGIHLVLWHPTGRNHYFFAQPGLRFRLTARGGQGAPGRAGAHWGGYNSPAQPGLDGTAGGNGGRVVISTSSAPWREYLDVDVSSGKGGKGGRGGMKESAAEGRAPDGRDGVDGFSGRVETMIQDGW